MTTLLRAVKKIPLLGLFAFLFLIPMVSVVYGQATASNTEAETTSCSDFYSFNSVKIHLENSRGTVTAGSSFPVRVSLTNENDYPIVSGSLYIKAYKKPTTTSAFLGTDNGDIVDAFYGLTNISIPAKGSISKDFTWKVPVGAVSGTYRLSPFFLVSNQFDVTGLSYSDDVHGAPLDVSVIGEATGSVYFDRQSVVVDGQKYRFAALPLEVSSAGPVKISVALVNDTDELKTVPTSARIYRWSSNTTKNYISDIVHPVVIAPRSRTTIEFALTEQVSVPFVEFSATDGLSKTMMGIRFVRKGVSYPRFNFLGLKPSADGTSNQVFACFHGAGNNLYVANGGKVVISATDSDGKVLGTKTYQGEVSGATVALAFDAALAQKTDKIIVRADSFQNGKIADSATVTYRCGLDIPCTVSSEAETSTRSETVFILLAAFVGIAIITAMFLVMKKKKINPISLAVVLALSVGIFASAHSAYAACYMSRTDGPIVDPSEGFSCRCTVNTMWVSSGNGTGHTEYTGSCSETVLPTSDFCSNIPGMQTSVPGGYDHVGGLNGTCTPHDYCPNIDGMQLTVAPYVLRNGLCSIDSSTDSAQKTVAWSGSNIGNGARIQEVVKQTLSAIRANRAGANCDGAGGGCYLAFLGAMSLSLYYGAEVVDAHGHRVDESTILKAGDELTVRILSRKNDQINWSVVGGVVGTPYGYWSDMYSGTPSESDLMTTVDRGGVPYWKFYTPVTVDPPAVTIEQTGTAGVSRGASPWTFTVTSPGTVIFKVNFGGTKASTGIVSNGSSGPVSSSALDIPARSITFNYVVGGVENRAPDKPTISGPTTLSAGSAGTYTIKGTDPDSDQVYYDVSFLGASPSGATRLPGSGLVNSGTSQTIDKSWLTQGSKTVWARTVDSKGVESDWTSYDVSVTESFALTTTVSGSGSIASTPAGIDCGSTCAATFASGAQVTLTATASGAATFTGWSGDCSSATGNTCTVRMDRARTTIASFTGTICTDPSASNHNGTLPCIYKKTLTLSSTSCGGSPFVGGGQYNVGSAASFQITPAQGYGFVDWKNKATGAQVSTDTTGSIVMNVDTELVASCTVPPTVCPVGTTPGTPCTSPANNCGTTNSGTYGADCSCGATRPANETEPCGPGPRTPTGDPTCPQGENCPAPRVCEDGTELDSSNICRPKFNLTCQPAEAELQIIKGFSAASRPVKVDVGAIKDQQLTFSAKLWSNIDGYITDSAVKYIWNGVVTSSITLPLSGTTSVFPQPEVSLKVTRPLSDTPDYRLVVGAINEYGIYHECPVPTVHLKKSTNGVIIKEH
jgi:hypothetical protein